MNETSDVSKNAKIFFYTYTLYSLKDKKIYNGFTSNLVRRLKQHQGGRVTSTKHRRPLILIHAEKYISKRDAKAREVFLKSGFGRKQLLKSLKNTLEDF